MTAAAIHITTDINSWFEGPSASDVKVQNCTIEGVDRGAVKGPAAIWVFAELPSGTPWVGVNAPEPVHHDITIANNSISNVPNSAVYIGSSEDVKVTGNIFSNICYDPSSSSATHPVYIANSNSVNVADNVLLLSAEAGGLGQESSMDVTVSGNDF